MRSIEITTTQNVTIEYELAGIGSRILAFALDFIIVIVAIAIFSFALGLISAVAPGSAATIVGQIIITCVFVFYTLVSEVIGKGQTIGKLALGIRVVRVDGAEIEFYDYFTRWAFRVLDIFASVGSIALLLISSTEHAQRLGDIVAGTTVIKKRGTQYFSLDEILNLKSLENYQPEYPLVRNLSEQDVILIKNVLYREKQYRNGAHSDALHQIAQRVAAVIEAPQYHSDIRHFLRKVISDYIVLTR